jgi:serine/threonine protein phosphatase 1
MIDVLNYPSPEAPETTTVYAVGDIHGRLDLLQAIDGLIAEDIAARPSRRPTVCHLGDYIDRGPQSAQVIEYLSTTVNASLSRVFLKGNHEDRMLEFLAKPAAHGASWLHFGGREALASYGVSIGDEVLAGDWDRVRDQLQARLPATHLAFLRTLRLAFVWRGYVFVHAGLSPDRPMSAQDPHDLMWIKEPFQSSTRQWPRRIVHGHVVGPQPVFRANRIGIDTGASRSGRLTCLVLSDGAPRILQT